MGCLLSTCPAPSTRAHVDGPPPTHPPRGRVFSEATGRSPFHVTPPAGASPGCSRGVRRPPQPVPVPAPAPAPPPQGRRGADADPAAGRAACLPSRAGPGRATSLRSQPRPRPPARPAAAPVPREQSPRPRHARPTPPAPRLGGGDGPVGCAPRSRARPAEPLRLARSSAPGGRPLPRRGRAPGAGLGSPGSPPCTAAAGSPRSPPSPPTGAARPGLPQQGPRGHGSPPPPLPHAARGPTRWPAPRAASPPARRRRHRRLQQQQQQLRTPRLAGPQPTPGAGFPSPASRPPQAVPGLAGSAAHGAGSGGGNVNKSGFYSYLTLECRVHLLSARYQTPAAAPSRVFSKAACATCVAEPSARAAALRRRRTRPAPAPCAAAPRPAQRYASGAPGPLGRPAQPHPGRLGATPPAHPQRPAIHFSPTRLA